MKASKILAQSLGKGFSGSGVRIILLLNTAFFYDRIHLLLGGGGKGGSSEKGHQRVHNGRVQEKM